jgi:metal-sulfur cluster biosynthetic enzyme
MTTTPDREQILEPLHQLIDPEVGVDIVELGLVETVESEPGAIRVGLLMTSPACPHGDYLAMEAANILRNTFGAETNVNVEVLDDPVWTPERMSASARALLGG